MKKYLSTVTHSLLLMATLTMTTIAADNKEKSTPPNIAASQLRTNPVQEQIDFKQMVEEDYRSNFSHYHLKAITAIKTEYFGTDASGRIVVKKAPPKIGGGFFGAAQDAPGWTTAIANFELIMTQYPLPPESQWPVRGFVKKYNEKLLSDVLVNIEQQKAACLKALQESLED